MTVGGTPHQRLSPEATARRNLLLSFPELDVAHDGKDVIDSLVEGVIVHLLNKVGSQSMLTLGEVSSALKSTMGMSYEAPELIASFQRIAARGRLSFRDDTNRSFVYEESAYHNSVEMLGVRTAAWEAVKTGWIDQVRQKHGISEEDASKLWQALDSLLTKVIDTYSAEAAAFLYLHDPGAREIFLNALGSRLPEISEGLPDGLREMARQEFPNFLDPSNSSRTDYLAARLRASFFFHLLSVDPTASLLVRAQVSEKVFYLDSNFLFRLIGFHGQLLAFSPVTAIQISESLKCRLVVSQETVNEFLRVLKANVSRIKSTPIHRPTYLRIAAEHPSDEGEFMAAFYREINSGRVKSVDDFGRKWSNIYPFLQEWGIEVDAKVVATDEEKKADTFLDEVSRLNSWQEKNPPALDHDVFMMHFIRQRRGPVDATLAQAKYWFLTYDRQLTRYAAKHSTDERLPVALLADDWLQLARPFLPRTEDYAKSFVAMLRYPILYQGSSSVPFAHMADALSRLEKYEELPPKVVAAMVADNQFVRSFLDSKSETAARNVVETYAGRVAGEAISRSEILEEKIEQMQQQISALTDNVDILHNARDTALVERDRALDEASNAASQVETMRRELPTSVSAAARAAAEETERRLGQTFQNRFKNLKRWATYWIITAVITVVCLGGLALHWGELNPVRRLVIILALAVVCAGLLWIPKGAGWALGVAASIASLLAFALAVYLGWVQFPAEPSSDKAKRDRPPEAKPVSTQVTAKQGSITKH